MKIKLTKDYGTSHRTGDIADFEFGIAITLIENRRGEPADDKAKAEYDGVIRQRQRDAAAKAKRDADEKKRRDKEQKALAAAPANKQLKPAMAMNK